jgi:hypothetical protein
MTKPSRRVAKPIRRMAEPIPRMTESIRRMAKPIRRTLLPDIVPPMSHANAAASWIKPQATGRVAGNPNLPSQLVRRAD